MGEKNALWSKAAASCALLCLLATWTPLVDALAEDVLAQSRFGAMDQEWVSQGRVESKIGLEVDPKFGFLKLRDEGDFTWYFASPTSFFSGDRAAAYNGKLSFYLQHMQWQLGFKEGQFDVQLHCRPKGLSMGLKGVVRDGQGAAQHDVILNERQPWEFLNPQLRKIGGDKRTSPTAEEFIKCLSKLQSVWIRGGYYEGPERTALKWARIIQGNVDEAATSTASGTMRMVSTPYGQSSCVADKEVVMTFDRPGTCDSSKPNAEEMAESNGLSYFCNQPVGDYGTSSSTWPTGPWILAPFNHTMALKGIPPICSTALLKVEIHGRNKRHLLYPEDYIDVYSENNEKLGRLFEDPKRYLTMQEGGAFSDTIPISAEQMAGMTADGQVELRFAVSRGPREVHFQRMHLQWFPSACFVRSVGTPFFVDHTRGLERDTPLQTVVSVPVPSSHDANIGGDAVVMVTAEGDMSKDAHVSLFDDAGTHLGNLFEGYVQNSDSRTVLAVAPLAVSATTLQLRTGDGASSSDNAYQNYIIRVVEGHGKGQERRIASYTGATRTITLDNAWYEGQIPTPQSTIHIVRVEYYDLDSPASASAKVYHPIARRTEWLRIPRARVASQVSSGKFNIHMRVVDLGNTLKRARFSPVRLAFPLRRCHSDTVTQGDVIGRSLYRPSRQYVEFPMQAPAPSGDATVTAEIFFQDHSEYTADATLTNVDQNGNVAESGLEHQQQLYPHGFSTIRVLAEQDGESLGFFLLDDLAQYRPSSPYVTYIRIPMHRLSIFVKDGFLKLTLVIPPGMGAIRIKSLQVQYPVAN